MAFALGSALLKRDIAGERDVLRQEEKRLQEAAEDAAKAQQKKGMWGSIGKTLGSIGGGALGTMFGGPAGGVLGAKMLGGFFGGKLGGSLVDTSDERRALESQLGKGKFLSSRRTGLKESSEDLMKDFRKASRSRENQLLLGSIASPLMAYGAGEGLSGFGKEALLSKTK